MKTVLITGAGGGIGSATARAFAEKGYNVALHANRSFDTAAALAALLPSAEAFRADISRTDEVARFFREVRARFGRVDVLVNNAAVAQYALSDTVTDEAWRGVMDVNLDGAFRCVRESLSDMLKRKEGSIVNISSVWGVHGGACETAYSASKAALIGMTKALARELGPSGIRVNCIAPGVIDTPMNAHFTREELDALCDETPLGRMGTPDEVASSVVFIAEARFITGAVLAVDGGFGI